MSRWQGRNSEKDQIRRQVWQQLIDHDAVITSPMGRIPTFRLAEQAASQLTKMSAWVQANTIKCNPDKAQIPVRVAALESGKTLLMAVPQLKTEHCFVKLNAEIVSASGLSNAEAAIAPNALAIGQPVQFSEMPKIDLVVVGCVAVDRCGGRTGKGAGFADLELGMLRQFGLVDEHTPIVTTVDSHQVLASALPMEEHDWPLDWVVTPDEAIATRTNYTKPQRINWQAIQADQWDSIPILKQLCQDQLGSQFVIRPVRLADAPQLLVGVNQVIAEQCYLGLAEPFSEKDQRPYIEQVITHQYPMVVAEILGQIIGNCDIIPHSELGYRHVGRLGMWADSACGCYQTIAGEVWGDRC